MTQNTPTIIFTQSDQPMPIVQSQANFLIGAESSAKQKSTFPCLLAIHPFDCIAWLHNRDLKSNRGIYLRKRFWSQAEDLDWSSQRL